LPFFAREGDFVHAVAEQGTRDVAVTLFDPGGRQLLTVDSLTRTDASLPDEEVYGVAETTGEHRLEVVLEEGQAGPCPLRLDTPRRATAADRERARAEAALARAHELRRTHEETHCREAVAWYEEAERRFRDLGLPARQTEAFVGEAQVLERLGKLRLHRDDLDGAIADDRQALELRRRTGNHEGEAEIANELGLALHRRGRYDEAAALFDRALDLWRESAAPEATVERANTLLNRGQLLRELGETGPARGRFRQALVLFRRARDHDREAAALTALGTASLDEGQPAAALGPLTAALPLRRPRSPGQAVTLNSLGVAYRQLGRPKDARRAYGEAWQIFLGLGNFREQAKALYNLGRLEEESGRDAPALRDFDQAAELFARLGDPPELAESLRGRAAALRHEGRLDDAREAMEKALDAVERHRLSQTSDSTRAAFFATQQGAYGFLVDLLMEMHQKRPDAGFDAQALEVSEQALARSLLDALAASGVDLRARAAPDLLARERDLEQAIETLSARQDRLAQESGAPDAERRSLATELERRWEELARVRADLRAASPRYAALTQPRPAGAAEIQRHLLDRDTLLLEYRLGEPRSFLWAVTADSIASFELPGRAELGERVRQASRLLAGSLSHQAEISAGEECRKLARVLLGPVADRLPGKRLLVVGDGEIQSLPFAALPEPSRAGGEPLVAHHEVVSLPSVSVLGELRREVAGRRPATRRLWVLADPAFGGAFPQLPYTRREAEAILALAPAGEGTRLLGPAASRAAVLGSPLSDYRILHFATHNTFAASDPGDGRLVLAQVDGSGRRVGYGFLRLADIYKLDLRADLVVLSACQSAAGREVRGEGVVGMTRGFFYAGADRVLVSLWNVNDRVSVELMRIFYREMFQEGLSPAAALRAAQDAIRRQERWKSPYYWAGFALQGEWR